MANDNLPRMGNDQNEDTVINDPQRTRPTETLPKTTATNPPIRRVTSQPPPTGQHVQPIAGQAKPTKRQQARGKKRTPSNSSLYLPWWSLAVMLISVLALSFLIVGAVIMLRNRGGLFVEPTPIIRIITAVPTDIPQPAQPTAAAPSTQIIAGGEAPTNLQLQGPTLEAVQFTPTPLPISVGIRVIVDGVDADKLNVRDTASVTQSTVLFRAEEDEAFVIVEGPLQGDGFTWWKIQDPNNPTRAGWAVSNFLLAVGE